MKEDNYTMQTTKPTAEEQTAVLRAIELGMRPSNYRLRALYDTLTSLPTTIEKYEPRLYSNPLAPRTAGGGLR